MTDISKGVALLDEMRPGWEERVSRKRLNMASSCDCVLGCVYGDYDAGLVALRIDYGADQAALLGFTIAGSVSALGGFDASFDGTPHGCSPGIPQEAGSTS